MIEQVILCTFDFTRETLLGRLQSDEMWIRQSGEFPRFEFSFSAPSVKPMLTRSVSISGDYASSS
jgi:hypothetical protein